MLVTNWSICDSEGHHPHPAGGCMLPWQCSKHTETATNIQADIWMAEGRAAHTNTQTHTRVSAAKPRPSVTLSPYERQIVEAISGGPAERLQPCSGVMEEVAAHRQALLAASHTLLSPPLTHFLLSIWGFYFPSELYVPTSSHSLAFTVSVLNAPVSTTLTSHSFDTITDIPISILQQQSLDQLLYEYSIVFWKCNVFSRDTLVALRFKAPTLNQNLVWCCLHNPFQSLFLPSVLVITVLSSTYHIKCSKNSDMANMANTGHINPQTYIFMVDHSHVHISIFPNLNTSQT